MRVRSWPQPDCRRVALDVDVMAGEKVLGHPEPRHALGVTRGDAFRTNQDRAVRAPDLGALGEELREERRLKPALVEQSEVAVDGPYDFVVFHPVECVGHDCSPWALPTGRIGMARGRIWVFAERKGSPARRARRALNSEKPT